MNRSYSNILNEHLEQHRQMIFVAGPRQVGKTTLCKNHASHYFSWDNQKHQQLIIEGPECVAKELNLDVLDDKSKVIVFDEIQQTSQSLCL
ncbi:hypothetical protein MHK_001569 [Candidatus Magnetomorum sp. HK-1]|nr:hypothetical protein MHK_001569 [Candidatus Magnetomorum sp. HK-1]